jgi:hypothetical protein
MSGGIQSDLHRNGFSRIHGLVEPFTGRTMPFRDLCHFRIWHKADLTIAAGDVRCREDCVEKLENRGAPKISQMWRIGDFSRGKAL